MARHVLIVDDDEVTRKIANAILEANGYLTTCVDDGKLALNALREVEPDVVLTDIFMGDIDGLQLIKEIVKNPSRPKIIAMSGGWRTSEDYLKVAKDFGADMVIKKPEDLVNLPQKIKELLNI